MSIDLRSQYGVTRLDALVAYLHFYFKPKGVLFFLPKFFVSKCFAFLARKYKSVPGFESNLERYYCARFFNFSVGKYSYGFMQLCHAHVNLKSIGAFCSIASNLVITGINHPLDLVTTHPFLYYKGITPFAAKNRADVLSEKKNQWVIIGNDVWIGQNVTILPSVKIGDGAVVGAGAVVTKDVPDYAIVVGNPAKVLRYRLEPRHIQALKDIRWWEWDDEKLAAYSDAFLNVDGFVEQFSKTTTK